MTDHEGDLRRAEQDRALDVYRPSGGAVIRHTPLDRYQEVVAVNRSDLENIRDFEGFGSFFNSAGTFFLGGGLWLGIDKASGWSEGPMPVIIVICVAVFIIGAILLAVGILFRSKKKTFIDRIFNETKPARYNK